MTDSLQKAGRVLAQKHIDSLRSAQEAIGVVIAAAEAQEDQEKASGQAEVKDEGGNVKSEGSGVNPSVKALALEIEIYALNGQEGVQ